MFIIVVCCWCNIIKYWRRLPSVELVEKMNDKRSFNYMLHYLCRNMFQLHPPFY